MMGTSRYTHSYTGNGGGSHSFSENIMPANRIRTGRKMSYLKRCSEVIWPQNMKLQPESERRGCKGKNQMKNEKKNT
jgi:hypothetical protein